MADTSQEQQSGADGGSPVVAAPQNVLDPAAEDINAGRDVVAMPSLTSSGKPSQTTGFKVLDEDGLPKAASTFDDPRKA